MPICFGKLGVSTTTGVEGIVDDKGSDPQVLSPTVPFTKRHAILAAKLAKERSQDIMVDNISQIGKNIFITTNRIGTIQTTR